MRHIYTGIGVGSAFFGVVYGTAASLSLAAAAGTLGFVSVIAVEFWGRELARRRRDDERRRKRAEKETLDKLDKIMATLSRQKLQG